MDEKNKQDVFRMFAQKAMKRLEEKKKTQYQTLYVPSLNEKIKIRSLMYDEVAECMTVEDDGDPNRADKYSVYIAVVEPDLREVAKQLKDQGEIEEYMDVVDIFNISEIRDIAKRIMELSGVSSNKRVTVVKDLKNS